MARPLRIELPGALYYVSSQTSARRSMFLDDEDRARFLLVLDRVVSRSHLQVYAYCLLGEGYELVVETPQANLSSAMRQLNGVYTQSFNRRYGRTGQVVQGRFKAILVDRNRYLLDLSRYVVLGPVRTKIARKPHTYRWSSYRATAGLDPVPEFLAADALLAQFAKQHPTAQRRYQAYVVDDDGVGLWNEVQGQVLLGGEAFVRRLLPGLHDVRQLDRLAGRKRTTTRPALKRMFTRDVLSDRTRRDAAIRRAHLEHRYSLSEIGSGVGLHFSTISRIVNRVER